MTSKATITTDVRGSMPSASKIDRIYHCPASFRLNASELPTSSAAAAEGTILHRVCELTVKPDAFKTDAEKAELKTLLQGLTDEQADAVKFATSVVLSRADAMEAQHKLPIQRTLEQRLWAESKLFSGQADVILFGHKCATIVDYKFGRGDVARADLNLQLAALAVLANDNYGLEQISVMIVQPRALDRDKRVTECVYDADAIAAARDAINDACKEAVESDNPTQTCGYWCGYCPSAYRCKAAQVAIAEQYKLAVAMPTIAIGAHNARDMYDKATVVKKYCDAVLSKVKEFVESNPDADCGLKLLSGARRAKLADAGQIYNAVADVGISPDEFVGACAVEMGKLTALYHDKRKIKNDKQTKKASDLEVKNLLQDAGLLTYTQTAPTLKLAEGK